MDMKLVDERDLTDIDPQPTFRVWTAETSEHGTRWLSVYESSEASFDEVESWAIAHGAEGYAIGLVYSDGPRRVCAWVRGTDDENGLIRPAVDR